MTKMRKCAQIAFFDENEHICPEIAQNSLYLPYIPLKSVEKSTFIAEMTNEDEKIEYNRKSRIIVYNCPSSSKIEHKSLISTEIDLIIILLEEIENKIIFDEKSRQNKYLEIEIENKIFIDDKILT